MDYGDKYWPSSSSEGGSDDSEDSYDRERISRRRVPKHQHHHGPVEVAVADDGMDWAVGVPVRDEDEEDEEYNPSSDD